MTFSKKGIILTVLVAGIGVLALVMLLVSILNGRGSSQIENSLTRNVNQAIETTSMVSKSSVVVKYDKGIFGSSVKVTGTIQYVNGSEENLTDSYKKNLKTIAIVVRDVGGIDSGTLEVEGVLANKTLEPGSMYGKDSKSISMKEVLSN